MPLEVEYATTYDTQYSGTVTALHEILKYLSFPVTRTHLTCGDVGTFGEVQLSEGGSGTGVST